MKKLLSIVLCLCLVWQFSSSLWTVVSFYIQKDYIAENLCVNRFDALSLCNGKCYLEKKLDESKQKETKSAIVKIQEVIGTFFSESSFSFLPYESENQTNYTFLNCILPASRYLQTIDQPPEY